LKKLPAICLFFVTREIPGGSSIPESRKRVSMAIHVIPVHKLSTKALQGVIEEFISRNGTDYGAIEVPLETSFRQVKNKLKNGSAVLVFDDETETTNIFAADDPVLKKIEAEND